ncbi:BREX system serine/threonine kinase PglW [Nocardia cyriacigeorgica]|uniref:Putative serine/threonine protein kinase n=1 Tax=Nocardia cyriacigeorgica (strain GUH-2) TaxID=1127134 RepID=H6RC31_NOCCG|nr:BREX system serine/threonine kinase PglW [Nocardia cyriacigeorgica]CCF62567.1 putative serine/threonine protein kinase [Nocardia cyriacigeorgica GUH-2]
MDEGRWTTVTESSFEHERRGLEAIRTQLPNVDPWYAWSNFTFTAKTGHIREVDLLVIAANGVYMIELKDWSGRLTSEGGDWVQTTTRGDRRFHRNPLHLVNQKSKELAGLLGDNGARVFLSSAVCLTNSGLRFDLPTGDRASTYTVRELIDRLHAPVRDIKHTINAQRARAIKKALEQIGIRRSDADFTVGPYLLERKPLDAGPTWQDYLAVHTELREPVRVRLYLRERGADEEARKSVDAAARREAAVLRRFRHPGAVQLELFDPSAHTAGPALIFRYHPDTLHLDDYLARHGASLDIGDRIELVRQLAETLRSAHSARLYHRALAARSIHVVPRPGAGEAQRWRSPRLQISDWQVATQRSAGTALTMTRHAPTLLSAHHLSAGSDAYLAPEVSAPSPDPIAMDVYGLGLLTYLLVTGRAPAATQAELLARFEAGEDLRPSALVDNLPSDVDLLVAAATDYRPSKRLTSMDEFLELVEDVEESLTAPAEEEVVTEEKDPLDAVPGDVLAGRWLVRRRLGTGSTSRALLVRDLQAETDKRGAKTYVVLKIALSDDRADLLEREAGVLRGLRRHSGVINLVDPGVLVLGGRKTLVLEYVGDEQGLDQDSDHRTEATVARELRDNGRLQVGRLETYSDYLFAASDFLEGEGVWHRDLKPDNIAIRVRPNRTRELVLIDFSLAGYPVQNTDAGTDGYLDPFIGTLTRSVYDAQAERYALAVTLHEMASGELPRWGDGSVLPRQLDPAEFPYPKIAADAFDASVRDGLVAFFRKALHRDAGQRFSDLKPMRDAWRKIFLDMSRSVPSRPLSSHPSEPVDVDEVSPEDQRRLIAEQATVETHLSQAGLTAATEQFLYGLGVNTVGELLDYGRGKLINAPGLGARARREIQDRLKEWGRRFGKEEPAPLTPQARKEAKQELDAAEADLGAGLLRTLSLDTLAARFVPERNNNGSNASKVDAVARLLRIPGAGDLPELDAWPTQSSVAESLNLTSGRVAQLLKAQRQQWKKDPAVQALRDQVLELLEEFGRVAAATELADALAARRGTRLDDRAQRRALGLAAVRVVVEVEQLTPDEAALYTAQKRDSGANPVVVLALEAGEEAGPGAPAAPALANYALRLGRTADALAAQETLPTAATVLDRLGAIEPPAGTFALDERRLVQVAVSASRNAAVTPRLEIYPRDLPLVRAVRLTQAGLLTLTPGVPLKQQTGLRAERVFERILARFPELVIAGSDRDVPTPELTKALREAGFDLVVATHPESRIQRYIPEHADLQSSYTAHAPRWSTAVNSHAAGSYSDDPDMAKAARAEELLTGAAPRDGFRVLTSPTSPTSATPAAIRELRERFSVRPMSATALFLANMHDLVPPGTKPTWDTILRADIAEPGSRAALKFSEYARTAWGRIETEIADNIAGDGPLLLTDTLVFARYDAMGVLGRLAEQARRGKGGLWLLCPQSDPLRQPHLGTEAVPYQSSLNEWIQLPEAWIRNIHRTSASTDTGVTA